MEYLVFIALAFAFAAIGFYYYICFFTLGYGFSIASIGLASLLLFSGQMDIVTIAMSVLFIIWGCRLGGFLYYRDRKTQYKKILKDDITDGSKLKAFVKIMTWILCAVLYISQASPLYFRITNGVPVDTLGIIGVSLLFLGIAIEMIADFIKNKYKKTHPRRFCDFSIYKIVRCPNYFGEILMWTGVFISGISVYNAWYQWLIASVGYLGIIYVMISGARRLELRQERNYGQDPEYQEYIKKTPILLPLIPIKSVKNLKMFVA